MRFLILRNVVRQSEVLTVRVQLDDSNSLKCQTRF